MYDQLVARCDIPSRWASDVVVIRQGETVSTIQLRQLVNEGWSLREIASYIKMPVHDQLSLQLTEQSQWPTK